MCGEILTIILTIIQTISIVLGVVIAIITLISDHKRRKRQATMDYYLQISEKTLPLRNDIRDVFKSEVIYPTDERYKPKEMQRTIRQLLSSYEHLAVGINHNVFDLEVFMRMSGKVYIDWYYRLEHVIESKRKANPSTYSDFEQLAEKMQQMYGDEYVPRFKQVPPPNQEEFD